MATVKKIECPWIILGTPLRTSWCRSESNIWRTSGKSIVLGASCEPPNHKDIDNFANLLDIVVVNLKDAGRQEEFGDGSLYVKLQKKITESMLAQYH